jgi:hypothetical protein
MEYKDAAKTVSGCAYRESVRRVKKAHEVQLVNYHIATAKPEGLILNFGERKVEIKRKVKACPGAM